MSCTHTDTHKNEMQLFYFYKYSGFNYIQSFCVYLKSELEQTIQTKSLFSISIYLNTMLLYINYVTVL